MVRRLCLLLVALTLAGAGCAYRVDIAAPAAQAETTKVFAADGSLITTLHAEQDREQVPLAQMAEPLRTAVVAIEDSRFFAHKGVDLRAMVRALKRNAEVDARRITVGSSDGKVSLWGNVRSWMEKDEAENAAWAAPGVTQVQNNISIVP